MHQPKRREPRRRRRRCVTPPRQDAHHDADSKRQTDLLAHPYRADSSTGSDANRGTPGFRRNPWRRGGEDAPVWALTELLELGQLSVLYRGLRQQDSEQIALAFGAPTKKIMVSWLASLNYVRNVAAHHARLFNRKLQNAPARPKAGQVPVLDRLRDEQTAKGVFGTYNALAVIAHLLPSIEGGTAWRRQLAALLQGFPTSHALSLASIGVPQGWESLDLWRR